MTKGPLISDAGVAECDAQHHVALLGQRDELSRRLARAERERDRLRQHLQETDRGVVTLHAELDEQARRLRTCVEQRLGFAATLGHELRTPLNAIGGLARLLLTHADGPLLPEQERQVQLILASAQELRQFVDDVLDLARRDSTVERVQVSSFRVRPLLTSLRALFRPLVPERVRLVIRRERGVPALTTDEQKLARVLRNLVSNALKFTEAGTVRLVVRYEAEQELVLFAVEDTGIGIDDDGRRRLFHEFAQLRPAATHAQGGSGLGLVLARRLTEQLGGKLALAWSEPGVGSRFELRVPRRYPLTEPRRAR